MTSDATFANATPQADEHDQIVASENNVAAVNRFLSTRKSRITPVALATLAHHFQLPLG